MKPKETGKNELTARLKQLQAEALVRMISPSTERGKHGFFDGQADAYGNVLKMISKEDEEELVVDSENDGKGKIIGYFLDFVICEVYKSIPYQMTKEETEMYAEAMNDLAAALKKRGKTLGDLL